MKLINHRGESLDITDPDILGSVAVLFNGRVVERVRFDDQAGAIVLSDGRKMRAGLPFAAYLLSQLDCGAYREAC